METNNNNNDDNDDIKVFLYCISPLMVKTSQVSVEPLKSDPSIFQRDNSIFHSFPFPWTRLQFYFPIFLLSEFGTHQQDDEFIHMVNPSCLLSFFLQHCQSPTTVSQCVTTIVMSWMKTHQKKRTNKIAMVKCIQIDSCKVFQKK